jgi:hypothetical protein
MHRGVLVGVVGALCATVALVLGGGFVVLGPVAFGGDGCCGAQAAMPTHTVTTMATNRIAFDMGALSDLSRNSCGVAERDTKT